MKNLKENESQPDIIENQNEEKTYDIRERTLEFGIRIVEISDDIPNALNYGSIRSQLIKAGTSVGANLAEGDGAKTKRDFVNKLVLARKEAKETKYWLRLLNGLKIEELKLDDDIEEIQEIINILSSIINKIEYPNKNE